MTRLTAGNVTVSYGYDDEFSGDAQQSGFTNATQQARRAATEDGDYVSFSIAMYVNLEPYEGELRSGIRATANELRDLLCRLCVADPRLMFDVQVGRDE
jgi:hypothetical protein